MNAKVPFRFTQRLIMDLGRKVFLVLGRLQNDHSHVIKTWMDKQRYQITVFFLTSYSPGLNTEQFMNNDLER